VIIRPSDGSASRAVHRYWRVSRPARTPERIADALTPPIDFCTSDGKTWRQAVAQASTALTRLADAGKAVWVRLHGGGSLWMTHTDADELLAEVLAARDHAAGQRQEA
jgi:hypothetical protein